MKRILITGANGFIGKNLIKDLSSTDWDIVPLVRRSIDAKNEVIIDFCDGRFSSVIDSLPNIEAVIHLGAKIEWREGIRPELFTPNVFATNILLNWAKKINAHFIFASTSTVCGMRNPYITSTSSPKPDTNYAYSKWLGEELIRFSGVKYAIIRIGGVFGFNGPSHLGINNAINRSLEGIVPVQHGSGSQRRNYIYVKDLCRIIRFCVENVIEGTHLAAGSSIATVSEMLNTICDILLPCKKPDIQERADGNDQIVEPSALFPKTRSFKEAILEIKDDYARKG